MSPLPHYANAVRAEPGRCWRMVSRPAGYRVDTLTDCLEPPVWIGRAMVSKKRMRLWSCEGHAEGLEDSGRSPHRERSYAQRRGPANGLGALVR